MKSKDFDLSRSEWEDLIEEWILSTRNREIMRARLIDGMTYEKIAERFEISVTQAKAIVCRCGRILTRHIH